MSDNINEQAIAGAISEENEISEELRTLNFEQALEAVLFAAGHPVSYDQLSKVFEMELSETVSRIKAYAELYNNSPDVPRGVILLTFEKECQLCTKAEYISYIREALGIRRNGNLSTSSIETLAIIAYNQPVTRSYIDTVRGVDSNYAVSSLLERGLIEAKGRLDAPGRPMLYGTSANFLRCFGISSLSELPGVNSEEVAELMSRMEEQLTAMPDKNQITLDEAIDESIEENETRAALKNENSADNI